jgi:hypothetical protein
MLIVSVVAIVTGLENLLAAASQVYIFWAMLLFPRQLYFPLPHHAALLSFFYLGIVCGAYVTFTDMNDCASILPYFHQFALRHSFTKFTLLPPLPSLASVRTQHICFLVSHIYNL